MRFKSIQSGSNGNVYYIGSENTHILVDAGISCKRITEGIQELDVKGEELSGICITHEHSDHISGLPVFLKKYKVPVYGTRETLEAILEHDKKNYIDPLLMHPIEARGEFEIGDVHIASIPVSHDAKNPVAYRFENGKSSFGIITDLGTFSEETVAFLQKLSGILIEANHEVRLLETGPYPYALKRRILGNFGHLSNERSGQLLNRVLHGDMKEIFVGHLSQENNIPELAVMAVQNELDKEDTPFKSRDFQIKAASRTNSMDVVEI